MTPSDLESYLDAEERDHSRTLQTRSLRALLREMLRYRAILALGLSLILVGTFATLLEPRLFGYAIDEAIVPRKWGKVQTLAAAYLLIILVRVIAAIGQGYLFELLGQRVTQDLRMKLFAHLQRLPASTLDRNPAGRLLTRVTNDIGSLADMFSAGFVSMLSNALFVLGILAWLIAMNVRLGLIAAAVFPFMIASSVYFSSRLRVSYREARSKLSALNAFLAENLLGMKVVHLFNRQGLHLSRFDRINQWYADAQIGTVRVFAMFQPTITVAAGASMALVIAYGGRAAMSGTIQLGVLVAYFSYVLSLFQPVREIADKWNVFLSGMTSAERIFSILAWPVERGVDGREALDVAEEARPIEGLQGHIVFEDVWFAYDGEHWVLRDFNLEIRPGQRVGVVGHTGAGKTTLISLLMRFYEPQRGRILLDGRDLREYDKRRLRASIGIVQQDVFLFSGSLRDNVTFWRQTESEGVRQARRALEEMGFGRWWEEGNDLQERGSNLSVGERQVLAFARALAASPRMWILDEATANLDSETERMLQLSLERASRGRTAILIAHRLATVRSADLVLVLHKGQLVEKGGHEELLALDGLYARLYRYQQAQERAEAARESRQPDPAPAAEPEPAPA